MFPDRKVAQFESIRKDFTGLADELAKELGLA